MTQKDEDLLDLAIAEQAARMQKQSLVLDVAYQRIDLTEYERRFDMLDALVDDLHIRYISRYKVVETVPDRVHPDALLKTHWN